MTARNGSPQERRSASVSRFSMRRWAAVLASCLVPGAGHWILGRYAKGLLLVSTAALDIAAMVKLADTAGGRHLLLIVFLGMVLPVLYFYSVFNTLQTTGTARGESVTDGIPDPVDEPFRWLHAVLTMMAGLLLLLLLRMPDKLRPWLDTAGNYGAPVLMFAVTAWIVVRRRKGGRYWLGRWTAAALSFGTGALLLSDEWTGKDNVALIGDWWPLLFVLFGGELLAYSLLRRTTPAALSADMSAVMTAVVIAVTAYSITQYAELPYRWLDQWAAQRSGYSNFSEEKGFSYDKPAVSADVPSDVRRIIIDNPNGEVYVQRGASERIVVDTTVWIDSADRAEADAAAEGTNVELVAGEEMSIKTVSQGFGEGGERKPRVNITVSLPPSIVDAVPGEDASVEADPQDASVDLPMTEQEAAMEQGQTAALDEDASVEGTAEQAPEQAENKPEIEEHKRLEMRIKIQSGDAKVFDIAVPAELMIEVGSGTITAQRISGTVSAQTVNGSVRLIQVADEIHASVSNGSINAIEAGGNVTASTANGGIQLKQVAGDIEVETKNGEVSIREAAGRVKADTLNGTIEVSSSVVGGDWDIVGLVGDVKLQLPSDGSYEMNGSVTFGQIHIDPGLPLTSVRKTVRGIVGGGDHRIYVNANSSIEIAPFVR
ncbi:DUF6677 family protein [Paenibacillus xylaniclasticus]|uniref:DUF6677 family protein n=1 Tax=Paenibacillus xylaniclasticus TaxID=588083 RepID=UPI000FDADEAA|nr:MULTISPECIES: DUF4097 family beta strand repeat-containing protein [Paenibacillus]GFN29747.1 hypothetical protein PCURB6_00070 [Paenibacillus curdlanolyticus]